MCPQFNHLLEFSLSPSYLSLIMRNDFIFWLLVRRWSCGWTDEEILQKLYRVVQVSRQKKQHSVSINFDISIVWTDFIFLLLFVKLLMSCVHQTLSSRRINRHCFYSWHAPFTLSNWFNDILFFFLSKIIWITPMFTIYLIQVAIFKTGSSTI